MNHIIRRLSATTLRALFAIGLLGTVQEGLAQGKIYFIQSSPDKIRKANLDGSSPQDVLTFAGARGLALDFNAGKIYFTNDADGKIHRANLDGTGAADLVTGLNEPGDLELDLANGKIFWADPDNDKLQRANFDGSNVEDLLGSLDIDEGIALNATGDSLYFIEAGATAIRRLNLLTNIVETLVTTGLVEPFDLELEANSRKIYWTDRSAGTICRADIDGLNLNVETLVTGLSSPHSLGLDVFENKMYWSTLTGGKIQRADLGGSNVEDLLTGLSTPRGLALDVAVAPSARFVSAVGQSFTISRSTFSASQGNIHSNSVLHFQRGAPTTYTGNLTAVGDIIIDKDNTIVGNVIAGGRIVLGKNSSIVGTATPGANVVAFPPEPCTPPQPCTPPGPCVDLIIGAGQSLFEPPEPCTPGEPCKIVTVGVGAELQLSSGEYHFGGLVTEAGGRISFDVSAGAVVIQVANNLSLGKGTTFNITPGGEANSQLVTIFALQSSQVTIDMGSYVLGTINAPNATVNIGQSTSFRGAVCAAQTTVDLDVIMLHHSSLGSLPKRVLEEEAVAGAVAVASYELEQNYPNPFWSGATSRFVGNPSTTIKFALPEAGEASLAIYNVNGQLVRTLYSGEMPAGKFSLEWEGKNEAGAPVASGVYLAVLKAGEVRLVRRLVLMR